MADHTKIEWTDATWNPITGCSVISPGCTNCYAMKLAGTRLRHHPSRAGLTSDSKAGPVWNGQVRLNEDWLTQPLKWSRPRNIFVCAHGDLFYDAVLDAWINKIFAIMALAPQHTFQVLTKRPKRMLEYLQSRGRADSIGRWQRQIDPKATCYQNVGQDGIWPLPNVILGVSVEDQTRADERRGYLGPLARRYGWRTFVSYEPALGPVDWIGWEFLSWMISGGESGKGARPSHPDWHRTARAFCAANGIPYMVKQWGEWLAVNEGEMDNTRLDWRIEKGGQRYVRVGKARAGRLLDGVEHNGMPEANHADITELRGAASIVLSTIREDSQFIVDHIARRQAADIITLCDEIERLRAQVGDESALATAAYMSGAHDARGEIERLKAENARLREALKPFAGHYQSWMDRYADDITSTTFPIHTFGDLRRARKALEGGE